MKKHHCENNACSAGEQDEKVPNVDAATEATASTDTQADALAALQQENLQLKDQYLRAVADLENYRRRVNREKDELRKYATDSLLEEFLPALDNLKLGLAAAKAAPDGGNLVTGFGMVADQLVRVLCDHGLREINPLGRPFDPNEAEAVAFEPSNDIPADHVSQVQRSGFWLHERLLRPARVVVSSGPQVA